MKQIYRYKGKHVLYNTGEVEESESGTAVVDGGPKAAESENGLTAEQMDVVLGSMSDNRINDSVKALVDQAGGEDLTEEQRRIVLGSMSDNRINDSVKALVDQNA